MNTGLLLIGLILGDGTELVCQASSPINYYPASNELIINNCEGHRIHCRPQQILVYLLDSRHIEVGYCPDVLFKDGFEEK